MDEMYPAEFNSPPAKKSRWPLLTGIGGAIVVLGIIIFLVVHGFGPAKPTGIASLPSQVQQRITSACTNAPDQTACQFNVITGAASKGDNPAGCDALPAQKADSCKMLVAMANKDKAACATMSDKTVAAACTQALQPLAASVKPAPAPTRPPTPFITKK